MEYTKEEVDLIVADSFPQLTYKTKKCFLAAQHGGAENIKYADALIKNYGEGVYNKLREQFYGGEYRERVLAFLAKRRVECTTIKSSDYPDALKNTPAPPLVLYMRGNRELLNREKFCVVGSRRTTQQALEECKNFCAELSKHFVICTGIADGADTAAALGALPSGNVICVLPCGHGHGTDVLRKVEEHGLSVSEFPPGVRAQQFMFALRNRILAGLSGGVLVVSAGEKGGALSTAGYAADYGKDVFAFPYGIGIPSGAGCNNLIKNGAYLCDSVKDVYSVMGVDCAGSGSAQELDGDEKEVLSAVKAEGEVHAERLAAIVNKPLYELAAICSSLEIKGLIVRLNGNRFAAV